MDLVRSGRCGAHAVVDPGRGHSGGSQRLGPPASWCETERRGEATDRARRFSNGGRTGTVSQLVWVVSFFWIQVGDSLDLVVDGEYIMLSWACATCSMRSCSPVTKLDCWSRALATCCTKTAISFLVNGRRVRVFVRLKSQGIDMGTYKMSSFSKSQQERASFLKSLKEALKEADACEIGIDMH